MVTVVEGGRGPEARNRIEHAVRHALSAHLFPATTAPSHHDAATAATAVTAVTAVTATAATLSTPTPTAANPTRSTQANNNYSPLFVVAPGTNAEEARSEALALGIPPNTGVLMRTSGSTTGTGKIVALSWDNLIASAHATHAALAGPGAWVAALSYHHIAGFQTIVRTVLTSLTTTSEAANSTPSQLDFASHEAARIRPGYLDLSSPDAISAELAATLGAPPCTPTTTATKGTPAADIPIYFSLVPTQLQRILDSPPILDALRNAIFLVGGAAINQSLLDRARHADLRIHTSYGMTETCGGCVYDGAPIGDTEILIDDDARISLRGSAVTLGYLGTAEGFSSTPPRTHHTQDAGRIIDGRLEVLGRLDDAITTGGLTVMPRLIEEALAKAGWNAVVVGVPDLEWGEAVVAIIDDVDKPAQSCNVTVMRSFVKLELGPGWSPKYVLGISQLGGHYPHTDSGKINRRELANMAADYLGL
ncbi:AMP-binding protein [Trueperella bialowiezensis]|uniref:2-succinylbenzoate--CoA ligase n=1 Tax=Trueperella bialowiezensis TaxID=312285 RepID=A0A3S4WGZ5_9ACTO|nr:AMP-binding protein [Trueperella bialowiezensis]VEI13689.1 2-succinylbenzoate--CoA ligase [Trueperella bialowiezensis]